MKITYEQLISEVEKPFSERRALIRGRNHQLSIPRRFHFTEDELRSVIEESSKFGIHPNPFIFRKNLYYGQVQALIELGPDEWHSIKEVKSKIKSVLIASNSWDKVINRKRSIHSLSPTTYEGKIIRNYETLQRLPYVNKNGKSDMNPYGYKLAQTGMCIDIHWKSLEGFEEFGVRPFYRLRTNFDFESSRRPLRIKPRVKRLKSSV